MEPDIAELEPRIVFVCPVGLEATRLKVVALRGTRGGGSSLTGPGHDSWLKAMQACAYPGIVRAKAWF